MREDPGDWIKRVCILVNNNKNVPNYWLLAVFVPVSHLKLNAYGKDP